MKQNTSNSTFPVWRVRLGNMFFLQSLPKNSFNKFDENKSFEFTTFKDAAWLFHIHEAAQEITKTCGGIIEMIELSSEEYLRLNNTRDYYLKEREDYWLKENGIVSFNDYRTPLMNT